MNLYTTTRYNGLTRPSIADYALDELKIIKGPATHAMLMWTGSRWAVELAWRGASETNLPGGPDPDSGALLRVVHAVLEAPAPDFSLVDESYRPARLISSRCWMPARAALIADSRVNAATTILARVDDPELA